MIGAKYFISGSDDWHDDELGFSHDEAEDPVIEYHLAENEVYHEPHEDEDFEDEEDE